MKTTCYQNFNTNNLLRRWLPSWRKKISTCRILTPSISEHGGTELRFDGRNVNEGRSSRLGPAVTTLQRYYVPVTETGAVISTARLPLCRSLSNARNRGERTAESG